QPADRTFVRPVSGRPSRQPLILVISLPEAIDNCEPGVVALCKLPRLCPFCRVRTIIGHGLRVRLAHDDHHDRISVRRGRCRPCRKTFTFLPEWVIPCGHYTLRCREQACERIASGLGVEQAAPDCQDPTRSPDATTLRRWAARRLAGVW